MILTQCAVCATDLGLSLGKKCGRCSTRYCGAECQKQHWEQGGHDKLCKTIKKAGGAEQYNANKRYAEAVTVAAEACTEDTKGQTCYICTQALHWKTKEGLVRMCACRGTAGVAHVSCLAEQAKILLAEAEENNLGSKVLNERWRRWAMCSLCEQRYYGVVACALGWACWKMYLGRPETDWSLTTAMGQLGNGLYRANQATEALSVQKALLSLHRRLGSPIGNFLPLQSNMASTYTELGRLDEAISLRRDVYSERLRLYGEEHEDTLLAALNYADTLCKLRHFAEPKLLLNRTIPVALRVLGAEDTTTLKMRWAYARALYMDPAVTLDDLQEAVTSLEELVRTARRVFGNTHPFTRDLERNLEGAREFLRRGPEALRGAVATHRPCGS